MEYIIFVYYKYFSAIKMKPTVTAICFSNYSASMMFVGQESIIDTKFRITSKSMASFFAHPENLILSLIRPMAVVYIGSRIYRLVSTDREGARTCYSHKDLMPFSSLLKRKVPKGKEK